MAYTEITQGMYKGVYTEITGISSEHLAKDPKTADLITEIGDLLHEYTHAIDHNKTPDKTSRNEGQDR